MTNARIASSIGPARAEARHPRGLAAQAGLTLINWPAQSRAGRGHNRLPPGRLLAHFFRTGMDQEGLQRVDLTRSPTLVNSRYVRTPAIALVTGPRAFTDTRYWVDAYPLRQFNAGEDNEKCRSTISGGRSIAARGPSEGKPSLSMQGGPRSSPLPLHVRDQSPLRPGVAVDVALGRLDGAMAGEELDVAQAASRAMNVAGGEGDEAAPPGASVSRLYQESLGLTDVGPIAHSDGGYG